MSTTRGVLHIHSAPSALCPHVEWAVGGVFGVPVRLDWAPQPLERASYRAEYPWAGPCGTAAKLASALKGWQRLRFETTELGSPTSEPERYSYTPALGIFHATTGLHGDIMVSEDRLRQALSAIGHDASALSRAVEEMLGQPWDRELEPFRCAGEDDGVRWLHNVV